MAKKSRLSLALKDPAHCQKTCATANAILSSEVLGDFCYQWSFDSRDEDETYTNILAA